MEEKRCQGFQFSRPFRAEASDNTYPWSAACGFLHGKAGVLPPGVDR
ncbi:MAG: hypothetical protein KDD67_17775 [Ignavibacteriae bacterium]|nr:hypothetical protein [Ignavibacteriota bacterium]MCB9214639.1 hypothetical protein [Ignavibacteria bacterium]